MAVKTSAFRAVRRGCRALLGAHLDLYRLQSMPKRNRAKSRASLEVLAALMRAPREGRYGLQLADLSGVKAGTLYPILQRLEDDGWIEGSWEDVDPSAEKRPRRRYYRLTDLGEKCAESEIQLALEALHLPSTNRPGDR